MPIRRSVLAPLAFKPGVGSLVVGIVIFAGLVAIVGWLAWAGWSERFGVRFDSFWISLTASFAEDLAFLLLVGIIIFVIQAQKPSEDDVYKRVFYFINGTHVTQAAKEHILGRLMSLGSYSPEYKLSIVYGTHNESIGAVKVTADMNRTIVNMFRNDYYTDDELEYSVFTDQVGDENHVQGEVLSAKIIQNGVATELVPQPLEVRGPGVTEPVSLTIDPDGQASFFHRYWVWHKIGCSFFIRQTRFTEQIEIRILNLSKGTLKLGLNDDSVDVELPPGGSHSISLRRVPHGIRNLFFLKGYHQ